MKLQDLKDMDKDDFLGLIGLQTKRSLTGDLLGTLGTFGIGLLVGAGVALLLAPKPGRDLRQDLRAKIRHGKGEGADKSPDGLGTSTGEG
ncbi:MAG TPA: YtxH domain-containing protein [Polyangia bacterium]|jgi:gas vesicle protein